MVLTLYQVRGLFMANDDPPVHLTEELPSNEKTPKASPSRPFCSEHAQK